MFFLEKIVLGSELGPIGTVFTNRFVVSGVRFMFLRYFEIFISCSLFIVFKSSFYRIEGVDEYFLMMMENIIFGRLLADFSEKP